MVTELLIPKQSLTKIDTQYLEQLYPPISPLSEDIHLSRFIDSMSTQFQKSQLFREGAEIAYAYIEAMGTNKAPQVSYETVQKFTETLEADAQRRKQLHIDTNYYVKTIPGEKTRYTIIKKFQDPGQRLLSDHLHYISESDPGLTAIFHQFDEGPTRMGAFTVFTLQELETARIRKIENTENDYPFSEQEPTTLHPNQEVTLRTA